MELALVVVGERQQAVLCRGDAFVAQAAGKRILAIADVFVESCGPEVVTGTGFAKNRPLPGYGSSICVMCSQGPYCTYLLGLIGAEVIKVEVPGCD